MGMMLSQMNDTEKEGDGERAIIKSKVLLLMFRSTVRSKKYEFEMLRLISKVKCQFTQKMAEKNHPWTFCQLERYLMLGVKRDIVLFGSLRGQLTICKATTSFPVK